MSILKNTLKCLAAATLLTATFAQAKDADPLKIGFVYVTPVGEAGWSYSHDLGRKAIEAKFGDKVETTYVEAVAEGADAERVITQLAKSGNDLIFTTSFGYMNPTIKVAKRFPMVKFEHATGYKRAKNVGTYFERAYESRYLSGVIAGYMTKSDVIGYVAAFPIPEVVRGINAFTLGLRSVKPNATVKVIMVNSWYNPGKEHEAATSLIQQGADIISQHTDSPGVVQAAEAAGVYSIGYHSDMSEFGPNAFLTAPIHNWDQFYVEKVAQVLDGTWKSEDVWGGLDTGMAKLAPLNKAIPTDVVKEVEELTAEIAAGKMHPFTGPINNQAGEVVAKKGEIIPDQALLGMDYYVEGVEGKLAH